MYSYLWRVLSSFVAYLIPLKWMAFALLFYSFSVIQVPLQFSSDSIVLMRHVLVFVFLLRYYFKWIGWCTIWVIFLCLLSSCRVSICCSPIYIFPEGPMWWWAVCCHVSLCVKNPFGLLETEHCPLGFIALLRKSKLKV